MKKVVALILSLVFYSNIAASVTDWRPEFFDMFTINFGGKTIAESELRINGHLAKLTKYKSDKEAGDIIGWYLSQALEKKYEIKTAPGITAAAGILFNAGEKIPVNDYDYIFYKNKDKARLVASANTSFGSRTVVADIAVEAFEPGKKIGYTDRLKHSPMAEKVLSLEFLNKKKMNCFGNFYQVKGETAGYIKQQYLSVNEKDGWAETYEVKNENSFIIILENGKTQYVLSITQEDNGVWLAVLG